MTIKAMADERGNIIECAADLELPGNVTFTGENNKLILHPGAHFSNLTVMFNASNGVCEIGANPLKRGFSATIRVGLDSRVTIGSGVSSTAVVGMSAVEGTSITVGDDVMFASQVQLRADDGHGIFDVHTGNRINVSQDIVIGSHVWLAWGVWVLGGAVIGDGTVIGANSLVNKYLPNNVVAVGSPARVVRKDIAWERPHVGMTPPYSFPNASALPATSKAYWNPTHELSAEDVAEMTAARSQPVIPVVTAPSNPSALRRFARKHLSHETRTRLLRVLRLRG